MNFSDAKSDAATLRELGNRIAQYRLNRNLTQSALATEAGVSKRTIERIEAGSSIQLSTMLQVLRVFKLLEPFGLALSAEKAAAPTKNKSTSERVENPLPAEPASKSHSWGY